MQVANSEAPIYASSTQKFLHEYFAKVTLSKQGIIAIVAIWIIYAGVSCYGLTMLEIDFKTTYFISPDTAVRRYIDKSEQYFNLGETVQIYVDAPDTDFTTEENQLKLITFNNNYKKCDECEEIWTISNTFKSWYDTFRSYA